MTRLPSASTSERCAGPASTRLSRRGPPSSGGAPERSGGAVPAVDRLLEICRIGVVRLYILDGGTRLGRGRNHVHDGDLERIRGEAGRGQSGIQRDSLSMAVGQKMLVHALIDQRVVRPVV